MSRKNRYKRDAPQPTATPTIQPAASGDPEWMAAFNMNRQVAQARREMGEQRWSELNREWANA